MYSISVRIPTAIQIIIDIDKCLHSLCIKFPKILMVQTSQYTSIEMNRWSNSKGELEENCFLAIGKMRTLNIGWPTLFWVHLKSPPTPLRLCRPLATHVIRISMIITWLLKSTHSFTTGTYSLNRLLIINNYSHLNSFQQIIWYLFTFLFISWNYFIFTQIILNHYHVR